MRSPGFETRKLSGWGRYPQETCHVYRPEKNSGVPDILKSGSDHSYISRGLGRSYGDAALNQEGGVISHTRLNRFLSFDKETGVLECEAGVSFAEIIQHFLSRGYFLPVTPGTKFVTVGGAVAADIHGKNHHRDGSLGNFICQLDLLAPGGQVFTCSPRENPEIFWATLGGMGLTGIILRARMRLRRVETAYIQVDYQRARNLDEALSAMTETDDRYEYSVAWIDCLARGPSLGRSILMRGNHARASELGRGHSDPLALPPPAKFKAPFDLPRFALNRFSVRAFNALYYARYSNAESRLVHFEKFFYPLDAIENWNRLYGKRGFVQYQVALPLEKGQECLVALLERLAQSGRASFLAVLKRFGEGNSGLLSFPMKGYTLALDLPYTRELIAFLQELDTVVVRYGGRIYLAKDAVQTPETFAAGYPRLKEFRSVQHQIDPQRRLASSLARRLRIV